MMNSIDELVKKLCHDGVECKELCKICIITSGGDIPKENYSVTKTENFTIPIISNGVGDKALCGYTDIPKITETAVTVSARGTIGYAEYRDYSYYPVVRLLSIIPHDKNELNCKYLYYCLQDKKYNVPITGIPQLTIPMIRNILIPLPPLEIQERIVNILDSFTELTSKLTVELKAELTARKKQYEYYRDTLLDFNNPASIIKNMLYKYGGVEYVRLEDIATGFYRGSGIKREDVTTDGIPCVRYGEIYTQYNIKFDKCNSYVDALKIKNPKYFSYGDILFAITGEKVKDIGKSIAYLGKEKGIVGGDIIVMKHNQNPSYISYALSTFSAQKQKTKGKSKNKVVHISVNDIKNIIIPLPPLPVQEYIVNILDRFDTLCNDLTKGLPSEIEMRIKQYEYYRDSLLNFKMIKR